MRIYKNDIIKASAISTGADRGALLCSISDGRGVIRNINQKQNYAQC
jgi:hypothetical protein